MRSELSCQISGAEFVGFGFRLSFWKCINREFFFSIKVMILEQLHTVFPSSVFHSLPRRVPLPALQLIIGRTHPLLTLLNTLSPPSSPSILEPPGFISFSTSFFRNGISLRHRLGATVRCTAIRRANWDDIKPSSDSRLAHIDGSVRMTQSTKCGPSKPLTKGETSYLLKYQRCISAIPTLLHEDNNPWILATTSAFDALRLPYLQSFFSLIHITTPTP